MELEIMGKLTAFIDGNTKPIPSHGYYILETGHLCCFVEHRVLSSQDLEWEALKALLGDSRFKDADLIVNCDNSTVVKAIEAARQGNSDTKAEGQLFNRQTTRLANEIVADFIQDRQITLKQIWGHENILDKMLRRVIKEHYNMPSRWSHEEIFKPTY